MCVDGSSEKILKFYLHAAIEYLLFTNFYVQFKKKCMQLSKSIINATSNRQLLDCFILK